MTQVIIVGAGPTGLTLGRLLARRGIGVKVIESARSFRRIFRGEALMPSGLAAIASMGLSALIDTLPHRPIDAWEIYIENRRLFRVAEPMDNSGRPCTLLSQPALLEAIATEMVACPHFSLIQGVAVQDLCWHNDRVSGVRLADGQTLSADLVIATDGRNSPTRERANLELVTSAQNFDILWFKLAMAEQFESENVFYSFLSGQDGFGLFRGTEGDMQLGWSIDRVHSLDWQHTDWAAKFADSAPDWLAPYFRSLSGSIDKPILLSVSVGRCSQWYKPGLLLLGDAVHPMSPIRAQGINMALRDAIVAANYLLPIFTQGGSLDAIDRSLPQIQREREPEIIKVQQLQQDEVNQGELIRNFPPLRHTISRLAPLIGWGARKSWLHRQLQLRQGLTEIGLEDIRPE
jgi:2-polyprenyl-6-methoxyphenol hydroxylase-like FAD-dependent oxidoreductase